MNNTPTENLRRQHAAAVGVPEDRVELLHFDLDVLNRMGTFVRIYAGGLTIFTSKASWTELGIPEDSARQLRYLRPPKLLAPKDIPDRFRRLAQRARDGLDAISVEVDFAHPYRWVGYADWAKWLLEFQAIQDEWYAYRQDMVLARHDALLQMLVDDYEKSAAEAYASLAAANASDLPTHDEFVLNVVSAAVARMPSPQYIRERLALDYFTLAVVRPAALEAELREEQREQERLDAEHQAEMERQRLAHLRAQAKTMALPLEQVITQLRREIGQVAQSALDVIGKHGGLRGRAGGPIQSLANRVAMLDPLGDEALMGLVREAGGLVQAEEAETDDQATARVELLEAVLRQIKDMVAVGQETQGVSALVAKEAPRRRWHSICLSCRYVWAGTGSLEPALCPKCKSNRLASREEELVSAG